MATKAELEELSTIDRQARVGRTAVQVGIPTAIVGVGTWAARLAGIDLDPGAGVDMPAEVVGYFIALVTIAIAWSMNRTKSDDGGEAGQSVLVMALVAAAVCLVLLLALHVIHIR